MGLCLVFPCEAVLSCCPWEGILVLPWEGILVLLWEGNPSSPPWDLGTDEEW